MSRKIIFAFSLILALSCTYDTSEDITNEFMCPEEEISYSMDVEPIMRSFCYSCHNTVSQQGGIVLEGYDALRAAAESGGLMGTIRHEEGFSPMPQGGDMLSDCNIQILQIWIDEGLRDN